MDLQGKPANLAEKEEMFTRLSSTGLTVGQRMHVGVVGNHVTDEATFTDLLWDARPNDTRSAEQLKLDQTFSGDEFLTRCTGVILRIRQQDIELPWGDLIELWPLDQPQG